MARPQAAPAAAATIMPMRERIHLHGADEDQRLGDRRQHALTVEGARQQPIVDQLELLVAGGLHREAANP